MYCRSTADTHYNQQNTPRIHSFDRKHAMHSNYGLTQALHDVQGYKFTHDKHREGYRSHMSWPYIPTIANYIPLEVRGCHHPKNIATISH